MIRIGADQAGKLPFSGARPAAAAKQTAWQGAIANEMGSPGATSFTPDVMTAAKTRIGNVFNDVAKNTSIPPEQTAQLIQDLDQIGLIPAQRVSPARRDARRCRIRSTIRNPAMLRMANTISGDMYQRLTNAKSLLSKLEGQNSNTGDFAGDVHDALDDALARSAAPEPGCAVTGRMPVSVYADGEPAFCRLSQRRYLPRRLHAEGADAVAQVRRAIFRGMAYTGGGNIPANSPGSAS